MPGFYDTEAATSHGSSIPDDGLGSGSSRPPPEDGLTLAALAALPRWVAWQTEDRGTPEKPRITKVPYNPHTGRRAKSDDPRTWGTRAEAEAQAAKLPKPFGSGGVGLMLGNHSGLAIGGTDLDTCRAETGDYAPWALTVLKRFNTYAEVSPSGSGAKLFWRYDPADAPLIRQMMGRETGRKWCQEGTQDHPPGIEMYIGGRFFAVTDQRLNTSPEGLWSVQRGDIEWLIDTASRIFAKPTASPKGGAAGDGSRSAAAFKIAADVKRTNGTYADFKTALGADERTAGWLIEKGLPNGEREAKRTWDRAGEAVADDVLLTEHHVALAFKNKYRDHVRFCHDTGAWFLWTGSHWRQDRKHRAFSYARGLVAQHNQKSEFKTQAITGRAAFAAGVERFARTDWHLAVTADEWNPDPWLLGTPGGTVDLHTGTLRQAQPGEMISRATAIAPDEDGNPKVWRDFLYQATAGDMELIGFLKRWCGYCLTGLTREHALLFIYGPGGNGKSVFLNTIAGILGEYHSTAAMDTFADSGGGRHFAFLAMLAGARMVTAAETEEGQPWAQTRINEITGGTPVTANFMRQNPFTFTPRFKITITGNHKPVLKNVDDAARRRFNIVPFLHKPAEPDRMLEEKLRQEWPAILRWMIDGCLAWGTDGLPKPAVVRAATDEYFAAQDAFSQWTAERCILDPIVSERPGKLLADLNAWLMANGEQPTNRNRFRGWAEKQPGLRYKVVHGKDYVSGLSLRVTQGANNGDC